MSDDNKRFAVPIAIIMAVITTAFGYGMLFQRVSNNTDDIRELKNVVGKVYELDKKLDHITVIVQKRDLTDRQGD